MVTSLTMSYDGCVRYVLDTCVIVSGLRSPAGVSAELLRLAVSKRFTPVLSVALVYEYLAVCRDPKQRSASGLSESEVDMVIETLCLVGDEVLTRFQWRPQLRDPSDEMVLEAAINGRADALVTFNMRDFGDTPQRFGIPVLSPLEALRRIQSEK